MGGTALGWSPGFRDTWNWLDQGSEQDPQEKDVLGRAYALEPEGVSPAAQPCASHLTSVSPMATLEQKPSVHLGGAGGSP